MPIEITRRRLPPAQRAAIHHALGDVHRLAVVDALALSDLTAGELGRRLDLPSNLLAHHLRVLAGVGLVTRQVSRGDHRRRYLRLDRARLTGLWPVSVIHARAVLFVCSHNSARSRLAEAIWSASSTIPAQSAGREPAARVHPGAVAVAARNGLTLGAHPPRGYQAVTTTPDVIISVCDQAHEAGGLASPHVLHWSIADPAAAGTAAAFDAAYAELAERIELASTFIRPFESQEQP